MKFLFSIIALSTVSSLRLHSLSAFLKDLNDPDNHDGVITHLEPDILKRDVKWALRSVIMSKASGGDGISPELFQILKDDPKANAQVYFTKK